MRKRVWVVNRSGPVSSSTLSGRGVAAWAVNFAASSVSISHCYASCALYTLPGRPIPPFPHGLVAMIKRINLKLAALIIWSIAPNYSVPIGFYGVVH